MTCRAWHLNAFALDFDYYKIDKYKGLSAQEMYEKYIKSKLSLGPTAVVDSGRGLYVIYTFKHSCKKVIALYQSIYKSFLKNFEKYGLKQIQYLDMAKII